MRPRSRFIPPILFFATVLALGGCVTPETPEETVRPSLGAPTRVLGGPLPPGCDESRAAVTHTFDAVARNIDISGAVGCITTTQWVSAEPTIGFTSQGTLYLFPAALRTLDAPPEYQLRDLGLAQSLDQGASWNRIQPRAGPANWHSTTLDPFLYIDPTTNRIFLDDLVGPCSFFSFSDDEGRTWTNSAAGCVAADHQSIAAGPPVTSRPTGYPNIVYRCAINYGAIQQSHGSNCQKSLDGGFTWQPPGGPSYLFGPDGEPYQPGECDGLHHHPTVDHRGWLWVPRGWCGVPYVAISKDEGATFTRHEISKTGALGHDAGVAIDPSGIAYYFWIGPEGRPLLSISKDDAQSWSAPRDVAPDGVTAAGMPNVRAGAPGKIAISYLANFGDEQVHSVITAGYNMGSNEPVFLTVIANAADQPVASGPCNGARCPGQYDFLGMAISPDGTPWMSVVSQDYLGAARLFGAPSLWDVADPNGPYKDDG
ncbi:MAG TPA: sialidase family protein [Candidatus Thermoplasmatota archaeon]